MRGAGIRGGGSRFLYEPFDRSQEDELAAYRALLASLGTPEQIREKIAAVDTLIEEKARRDWLFRSMRNVAAWSAAVAAGWLAFKGLMADFVTDLQR